MQKQKLKVGLVSLMHKNFTGDKEAQFNRSINEMKTLSEQLEFEFTYFNEGVVTDDEAWKVRKQFEEEKVDLMIIQNVSFAAGTLIPILARMNVYIGLWAVPEPTKEGPLPFNSFCGMNMNASIIGEYLKEYNIPFKWFYGNAEDELFINRFKITIKALTAVKNLKSSKIALIGGIVNGFDNQYFDERKVEKVFGTKVNRILEFSDIKNRALSYKTEDVREIINGFVKDSSSIAPIAEANIEKSARVYKAIEDIKNENGFDGVTISCWPKFRKEMDMVACATIGRLNYNGIVTACEGDIYGLIGMLTMRYLTEKPSLLMDLSDIDEEDESLLFWHCGIGCKNLAYKKEVWLEPHCNPGPMPGRGMVLAAPVAEMIFDRQAATVVRFTKEGEKMFLLSGEFNNPEKKSFSGTRGWLSNLKLNLEPIKVRNLMNTLMVQKLQHHYSLMSGDFSKEFMEIAAWLGIDTVKEVKYQDYLQIR